MPKFYVTSDRVQVLLEAPDAQQAAIMAFQCWCERQAEAMFGENADDCPLGNEIHVSEVGLDALDLMSFPTLDILMAWQVEPVEASEEAADVSRMEFHAS